MDIDDAAVRAIATADYDLPLSSAFVPAVVTEVRRRRRRRRAAASLGAVLTLGVGAVLVPVVLGSASPVDRVVSSSGAARPPTPTRQLPAVAGWHLDPPAGFTASGGTSTYPRWFDAHRFTDHPVADSDQVPVDVSGQLFHAGAGRKVWLFVMRPQRVPDHPDPAAVARQIAASRIRQAQGTYAQVRGVPGVAAGPATLFRSDASNLDVQVATSRGDVLSVESTGLTEAAVLATVRTLRYG